VKLLGKVPGDFLHPVFPVVHTAFLARLVKEARAR
jgi:hypothetical protein